VDSEARFFLLELCQRNSGGTGAIVIAHRAPEFAADAARGLQVPAGVNEFLDQNSFVCVAGLVRFHQFGIQPVVFALQACGRFRGIDCGGHCVFPFPDISRVRKRSRRFSGAVSLDSMT
jgi:hypothetical protein